MRRKRSGARAHSEPFARVARVALTLPGVTLETKYDGSPVLKLHGCFLAGMDMHPSAEPDTLVVRCDIDERHWLLEDAPEVFFVNEFHSRFPVVLARLAAVDEGMLRDLLKVSWRLTLAKCPKARNAKRSPQTGRR
jgi:hypothetical protein